MRRGEKSSCYPPAGGREFDMNKNTAKPKESIKKANKLIEDGRYTLAANQQKIIFILISLVREDRDIYKLPITYLKQVLNLKGESIYRDLDRLIEGIKEPFKIKKKDSYLWVYWVSSIEYFQKKGEIEFEISDKLKPYIIGLNEKYTIFQIETIMKFKSKYSIRLYELLLQYKKIATRFFTIKRLKEILELTGIYKRYHDFKKRVILPTQREMEEYADIKFEFEEVKKNKKVHAIKFYISDNKGVKSIPFDKTEEFDENETDLYKKLTRFFCLSKKQSIATIKRYKKKYIRNVLNYVEDRVKKGDVKNIGAYTNRALQEGWEEQVSQFTIQKQEEEKNKTIKREKQLQESQEKIEKAKEFFEGKSKLEQKEIYNNLRGNLERLSARPFIQLHLRTFDKLSQCPESTRHYIYQLVFEEEHPNNK